MADIYVTEYAELARDIKSFHLAAPLEPCLAVQKIGNPATTTQSSAFNAQTKFVMVHASAAAHVSFGSNPTATTSTDRLGAGETRFYGVVPGHKVAAINGA